ncbi:unnamed protein product [Linum trigynum]|uniref:Protein kinase domain-containing protein n=1 Tax=Linum trigynum TaxID=586398 RepID=A0AAV2D917_9ROSI
MSYLRCNAESAIAVCDPYNWDRSQPRRGGGKNRVVSASNNAAAAAAREFSYAELSAATGGFSDDNFLGKGSHGAVFRAVLDDGKLIAAVKRTNHPRNPDPAFRSNFAPAVATPGENEIEILSRVRHPGLVNLIGFCAAAEERKLLVVEYMPNGSLHDLLHSGSTRRPPGWTKRIRFALQVAKAVHALHCSDPPVIHRDIKSSNVLIDGKWKARLGDFGLALRGHVEDVRVRCTPPAGTLGYLDPGYLAPGDLSSKSDVFSFGILLLEIISGRNAIDVNFSPPSVVDWAVPLIKRCEFGSICDERIGAPSDGAVIRSLAVLVARCVRSTAGKRPGMAAVVEALKGIRKRAESPAIWRQLRRRVGRVDEMEPLEDDRDAAAVSNSIGRATVRAGSRKTRKVSSVSIAEHGSDVIGDATAEGEEERVVSRSRSIGSFGEMKLMKADEYYRLNKAAVRTSGKGAVRLRKSRSTGVLNGRRLGRNNSRGGGRSREMDVSMSKLGIGSDENKGQEKPLFSIVLPSS